MQLDYLQTIVPIVGLLTNAVVQLLGFRYVLRGNLIRSVFMGYFVGLVGVLICEYYLRAGTTATLEYWCILIANIITYSGLAYCYFSLIGLGVSLRIRLLELVICSPEGLLHGEIVEKFDPGSLVEKRVDRLVKNRQIREENGRLYGVNSPFLLIAKLNAAVKKFMIGKSSEFD